MAVQAVEARTFEEMIEEAAATTEALARQYFGADAYLRRDVHESRETGEELTVFEVHYCFDDWEAEFDRLAELHNAFMDAFVRATTPDILARVVIDAVPTDADQT